MLPALQRLAEERLAQAAARGELDNLPGAGQPLVLDDDRLIPAERRAALRILKNAGCVPQELQDLVELRRLDGACRQAAEGSTERQRLQARLQFLQMRLEAAGLSGSSAWAQYGAQVRQRLTRMR